jgi:hypothetical protein
MDAEEIERGAFFAQPLIAPVFIPWRLSLVNHRIINILLPRSDLFFQRADRRGDYISLHIWKGYPGAFCHLNSL